MNGEKLRDELRRDEGLELRPYRCTAGHWTIGYGHNLAANGYSEESIELLAFTGITREYAEQLLNEDIHMATQRAILWLGDGVLEQLGDVRQRVVLNMAFNLGGRLYGFRRLRACIVLHDWQGAVGEMLDSLWAKQVKKRALRLAEMMRQGDGD